MKWVLSITLLFSTFSIKAQTMEDLVLEAGNLFLKEDYYRAIPAAEKAAIALKEVLGEDNILYIGLLTIQASSYKFTYQFEQSEKIYLLLKEKVAKVSGENDESYTSLLNNMGGLYEKMGQFHKAEPFFVQAMEIRKRIAGEYDEGYATCMNGLATIYHNLGWYAKAEPLYSRVNEIRKKIYGEEHTNYAISLNNLATLYTETGQYDKAEALYLKACAIQKKLHGPNHADYALSLNNIANLWQQVKEYKKAESAYFESAEIRKNVLGATHPDYAASLNNIATLYADQGLFKKAQPYLTNAVAIWKKALGVNSLPYATGLNNLAAFYRKTQTNYPEAETMYLEAIRLRKEILGESHPYYAETLNDLGLLYMQMKQYKKAEPLFLSSSAILMKNISSTFTILSEKEKANYLEYNKILIDCNNSFLYAYLKADPTILQNNYNLELGYKSLSLADTRNMLDLIRNSKDTAIRKKFDQWLTLKNILALQYTLPAGNRIKDLQQKESEAEMLEKELNRISSTFNSQQKSIRVTFDGVRDHLEENEAAIEFVKFRLYNKKLTDSVIYAAYILRKTDTAPIFVPLCEEKQVKKLFELAGSTPNRMVKMLYRGQEEATDIQAKQGLDLYKLIWLPLEPYLRTVKRISYSPAGLLYGIAFHALPVDAKQILMDKYQLQQYTSTRQVALRTKEVEATVPRNVVLFGDALFTMDSLQLVKHREKKEDANMTGIVSTSRGNGLGVWSSLPGTAEEVKLLKQLFEKHKIPSNVMTGESASEDELKAMGGKSPQVLHIATHGFFLPEPETNPVSGISFGNVYSLANDPLLRSGLVMAGGNYVWSGKSPIEGIDDGIATAYEISQLNLSNTELLVLSACETALGDIRGSEGVFGLQRGFKMAGTRRMIVSLWQVPDKETSELMTTFYSLWISGKSLNDAFYLAQSELRKKYPAWYWAAFILVE